MKEKLLIFCFTQSLDSGSKGGQFERSLYLNLECIEQSSLRRPWMQDVFTNFKTINALLNLTRAIKNCYKQSNTLWQKKNDILQRTRREALLCMWRRTVVLSVCIWLELSLKPMQGKNDMRPPPHIKGATTEFQSQLKCRGTMKYISKLY